MQYDFDDISSIIEENAKRLEVVNEPYDPIVGTQYCEEIKRVKLEIPDAPLPTMLIPIEMENETVVQVLRKAGTLRKAGQAMFGQLMGGMAGKKAMGFEINESMMAMMGGFTMLRLITLAGGMMDMKFTKEQLLGLNAQLNQIKK